MAPVPDADPDARIVELQIGRPPRGLARVESRCAFGYPVAVSVDPLVPHRRRRGPAEPFPTRFWLTCPALVEEISRLESAGVADRLEEEMAADPALAARVAEDHARHAAERFGALDGPALEEAGRRGLLGYLKEAGVGGLRDPRHLKCLHAHYAHHRARGGAVGALLDARFAPAECTPDRVRCDAFGIRPPAGSIPRPGAGAPPSSPPGSGTGFAN
jgi:hypothetical protein